MKPKVYIDGKEGTTGLQIYQRLGGREDIELLSISEEKRKDTQERRKFLNEADLVFLCLPDEAAREAVTLVASPNTKIIDASTAHRTDPAWTYGFPELGYREEIRNSRRVANPGCHATGFLSIATPLVSFKLIRRDLSIPCFSLSGYSGAGKRAIEEYNTPDRTRLLESPRLYALDLNHKHIPEMMAVSGLETKPLFAPVIDDYYCGMATTILLQNVHLHSKPEAEEIRDMLAAFYQNEGLITVMPFAGSGKFLAANKLAGEDSVEISVYGDIEQTIITAQFDNLGKGASGAAVQNMNLMLGFEEIAGLNGLTLT